MKRMLSWKSGGTEPERGKEGAEAGTDVTVQILMKTPHQITILPSSTLPPTPFLSQFFPSHPPATRMHEPCNEDLLAIMDIGECGNDRPGFGLPPVSQKLVANNYKRLLEFLRR